MQQELGWWFPDGEKHLPHWMRSVNDARNGRLQYQYAKYRACLTWTERRRKAIDVGANIGLWSWNMAQDFEFVHAFEPVTKFRECWIKNVMDDYKNSIVYPYALGAAPDYVGLHNSSPGSFGDTFIATGRNQANIETSVKMVTLDSFDYRHVDFIKIDCEGYELPIILGAEKTIRDNKPCIIVEQKPGKAQNFGYGETQAVTKLLEWGMVLRSEMAGDYILSW